MALKENPMQQWVWRAVGWGAAVAVLAAAAVLYFEDRDGEAPGRPGVGARVVAVETAAVAYRTLEDVRFLDGALEAAAGYDVAPRIGGRIRALRVDIGDTVMPGDVIALLDDQEAAQEVAEAEAGLRVAEAQLAEAEVALQSAARELRRTRDLRAQRIASEAELDAAEAREAAEQSRVRLARAQIEQRRAALAAARIRLSFTEVRADWEGDGERVVGERHVDAGATVSAGEPLVSLLEIGTLRAVTFVTERDYGRLSRGQTAELRVDAHPDQVFSAEIIRMAPRFSPGSRQARVELMVPNPDGLLRPGMFARVRVVVGGVADAPVIPRDALVRRDGRDVVFVVEPSGEDGAPPRVRMVPVETGIRGFGVVEVRAPVLDGRVVTLGQHLLQDGSAVRPVDEDDERAAGL